MNQLVEVLTADCKLVLPAASLILGFLFFIMHLFEPLLLCIVVFFSFLSTLVYLLDSGLQLFVLLE